MWSKTNFKIDFELKTSFGGVHDFFFLKTKKQNPT